MVLEKDDSPELRIDIYFDREDDNFYCDGLILDQSIFIAFGNRVILPVAGWKRNSVG